MMKLFERHDHETRETLPELPEGITVPDDIGGLHATGDRRAGTRDRWLRWAVPVAVVAAGALVGALAVMDDGAQPSEVDRLDSSELVQRTERVPSGSPFDAVPETTQQVPSGSPFDAVLETTQQVPSGSPFDAPLGN
jgi:hypothetical protein